MFRSITKLSNLSEIIKIILNTKRYDMNFRRANVHLVQIDMQGKSIVQVYMKQNGMSSNNRNPHGTNY